MEDYKESRLASRPAELDPARYFQQTAEQLRLHKKREALRAQVKREYLMKLNDPHRHMGMVEDPAMTRWMVARNHNVYSNFRATPRNTLLGLLWTVGPFVFFYKLLMADRALFNKLMKVKTIDQRPLGSMILCSCMEDWIEASARKEKLIKEGKYEQPFHLHG